MFPSFSGLVFNSGIGVYSAAFIFFSLLFIPAAKLIRAKDIGKKTVWLLLALLIVARIMLLPLKPTGSDDYYRYIWDGKVVTNGINPYKYAPADTALNSFSTADIPSKVNFTGMKSIYFPVAQLFFAAAYLIGGDSMWGLKLLALLCEIVTIFFLFGVLKKLGLPEKNILLYAACPLPFFQIMIDAHIDMLGITMLAGTLFFFVNERVLLAGIFFGLSFMVKPAALMLFPFMFFSVSKNSAKAALTAGFLLISAALFIPFMVSANPFEALAAFSRDWVFNGFFFSMVYSLLHNNQTARLICGGAFFILYIVLLLSRLQYREKMLYSFLLLFLFTPVLHQWYVLWLAVLLPVVFTESALLLTSLICLSIVTVFIYQSTGIWKDYPVVLLLEYIPVVIALIVEIKQHWRAGDLKFWERAV